MSEEKPARTTSQARAGRPSTDEFAAFYRTTFKPLTAFVLMHGATLVEAADIVQDTMIEAYRSWDRIDHHRAWAYRVASKTFGRRRFAGVEDLVADPPEPAPPLCGDIENWEQQHDLVTGLDDALDLEAGLARIASPPAEVVPRPVKRLAALADELAALPATERLAVRAWLPSNKLAATRDLARKTLHARIVDRPDKLTDRVDYLVTHLSHQLTRVSTLVIETSVDVSLARRLAHGLANASTAHSFYAGDDLVDFEIALVGALDRILDSVTDMVGADLASTCLDDIPLDGVRWSSDTRWPVDWEAWVRDNSVPVSADVFEIRPGKAGSWLPT